MSKNKGKSSLQQNSKTNIKLLLYENILIQLTAKQSIYSKNFASVTAQSRFIIHHMNITLTFILHQEDSIFWDYLTHLQKKKNSNLRTALQSCLKCFTIHDYNERKQRNQYCCEQRETSSDSLNSDLFKDWQGLIKTVLMFFYRLSKPLSDKQKIIVCSENYLDTFKMIDLCLIYGKSNPKIVKQIIRSMFKMDKKYYKDFCLMFPVKSDQQIITILDNINFKDLSSFSNYGSPQIILSRLIVKNMFQVIQTFLILQGIFLYFPSQCKEQVMKDIKLFLKIMQVTNKLIFFMKQKWVFREQDKVRFKTLQIMFYTKASQFYSIVFRSTITMAKHYSKKQQQPKLNTAKCLYLNVLNYAFIQSKPQQGQRQTLSSFQRAYSKKLLQSVIYSYKLKTINEAIQQFELINKNKKNAKQMNYVQILNKKFFQRSMNKLFDLSKLHVSNIIQIAETLQTSIQQKIIQQRLNKQNLNTIDVFYKKIPWLSHFLIKQQRVNIIRMQKQLNKANKIYEDQPDQYSESDFFANFQKQALAVDQFQQKLNNQYQQNDYKSYLKNKKNKFIPEFKAKKLKQQEKKDPDVISEDDADYQTISFSDFKVFRPQDALSNVSQSMNFSLFKNGSPAYINMCPDFNQNNKQFQQLKNPKYLKQKLKDISRIQRNANQISLNMTVQPLLNQSTYGIEIIDLQNYKQFNLSIFSLNSSRQSKKR